LRSDIAG